MFVRISRINVVFLNSSQSLSWNVVHNFCWKMMQTNLEILRQVSEFLDKSQIVPVPCLDQTFHLRWKKNNYNPILSIFTASSHFGPPVISRSFQFLCYSWSSTHSGQSSKKILNTSQLCNNVVFSDFSDKSELTWCWWLQAWLRLASKDFMNDLEPEFDDSKLFIDFENQLVIKTKLFQQ